MSGILPTGFLLSRGIYLDMVWDKCYVCIKHFGFIIIQHYDMVIHNFSFHKFDLVSPNIGLSSDNFDFSILKS